MARINSHHPLTLYRFMLDRWWGSTLLTGSNNLSPRIPGPDCCQN